MNKYGNYYNREEVESQAPDILIDWDIWLDAQRDPGHYETFKDKSKIPAEWITETYMPPHLEDRLPEAIRKKE